MIYYSNVLRLVFKGQDTRSWAGVLRNRISVNIFRAELILLATISFLNPSAAFSSGVVVENRAELPDKAAEPRSGERSTPLSDSARAGDAVSQLELANSYFHGKNGYKSDFELAAYWFRLAAKNGVPQAQFNLALCYDAGYGLERDVKEAARLYRLAADAGIPQAKYNLAIFYAYGVYDQIGGVFEFDRNPGKAISLLEELCGEDFPPALTKYAEMLISGDTAVSKDDSKALELVKRASAKNDPLGLCMLADFHFLGRICPKDEGKAVELLKKASELGSAEALAKLAYCHERGVGVELNSETAFKLYQEAAQKGNSMAQVKLGDFYFSGIFVPQDVKMAKKWYLSAGDKNHHALYNLACMSAEGIGEDKDAVRAARLFLASARLGNALAQFNIASCFSEGNGIAKDLGAAFYWFKRSAEQGNAKAQRRLAICCMKGEGTEENFSEGLAWLEKAAANGDPEAQDLIGTLMLGQ